MNYLDIAIKAAKKAGRIHKKYFQRGFKVKTKSASFDLLTIADTQAEKVIVSLIKEYFPRHNFLCEERAYAKTASEYTWIIDPLDGTNNYASGLPIFCASVALAKRDKVIAAAIYDVMRNELFYAQKGRGAFLNGRRIRVNMVGDFRRAILITGFYYDRGKEMLRTLEAIKGFLFKHILGLRRLGAAALDLCYVASGRAAGFWEFELSPWDFAAGKLIIEEAGGKVTGRRGEMVPLTERHFIVASNGKMHKAMLKVINNAQALR